MPRPDTSPRAMAARYARSLWGGPLDYQRKASDRAWAFATPGHGGLVVIPEPSDPRWPLVEAIDGLDQWGIIDTTWQITDQYGSTDPVRAVTGEEDCAWAIVILLFPEIADGLARKPGSWLHAGYDTAAKILTAARRSAERNFPNSLAVIDRERAA
ncbi:MAG: hypothetical protein GY795_24535 [Desulfobacterales bacterium]|nr:hypothetical protein [Desulfobacterales bacterium]